MSKLENLLIIEPAQELKFKGKLLKNLQNRRKKLLNLVGRDDSVKIVECLMISDASRHFPSIPLRVMLKNRKVKNHHRKQL